MGDAEQVEMDSTPIFPASRPARPTGPTVRRRKQPQQEDNDDFEFDGDDDDGHGHEHGHGHAEVKAGGMPTYVRVLLLLSLIPIMYYIPKVLSFAGDKVQKNQHLLIYLWSVYGTILASVFFYFKRKTITLDSFATQIMAWLIFSLGIYHLVDLPKMVEMHLRKDVLYVWCSFTMIFNLVYFFIDSTDHQAEERKEKAKEEKRQKREDERKKRKAEKRKKELEKMMSPKMRLLVNTLIYLFLFLVLAYGVKWTYDYYLVLQQELAAQANPNATQEYVDQEKITDPILGEDY